MAIVPPGDYLTCLRSGETWQKHAAKLEVEVKRLRASIEMLDTLPDAHRIEELGDEIKRLREWREMAETLLFNIRSTHLESPETDDEITAILSDTEGTNRKPGGNRMKIKQIVREEDLLRIAGQADVLAKRARELIARYRQEADTGAFPPTEAVHDAERDLSSAFIAVIRVTSGYL